MTNNVNVQAVQYIGMDIGRGYVKAYSEHMGEVYQTRFKSIVALGRDMDFNEDFNKMENQDKIYIEIEGKKFFCGKLAELEGFNPNQNERDDKTSPTVKRLVYAALNEVAVSSQVKIMLGVPHKLFKKEVLNAVIEAYKGKTIEIKNKITGTFKEVTIRDILIFREADAALMWHVRQYPTLKNGAVAMVNVGFRTTELCFYEKGLKYNDKKSNTLELGNKTALEYVERELSTSGTKRTLAEIDSSDEYDNLKENAYEMLSETIANRIEGAWINLNEVAICACGGTSQKLTLGYEVIDDPQMATSKGLYLVAKKKFSA
ncbi:MAG: ParM/StbA family protein [Turicibacter sp.]|nr:ParM/StbA family protein [Turicibacter sp.]